MQRSQHNIVLGLILTSLSAFFTSAAMAQVTVTAVDGSQTVGKLQAWNSDSITISTNAVSNTLAFDQLLEIRWPLDQSTAETHTAFIELVDGARFPIKTYEVTDSQAAVNTPLSKTTLQLSTNEIRRVLFTTLTTQLTALWSELNEKQLPADILVVHKKKGTVLDYLPGLLGDINNKQVRFNWDGEEIPVQWSKVAALSYYHANQPKREQPIFWLQTQNGARLPIAKATAEGELLRVATLGGLEFTLPNDSLVAADFSQGKLTYLSDLEPIKQTWIPRVALPAIAKSIQNYGLPRRNQSFSGSALTLSWPPNPETSSENPPGTSDIRTYRNGLAIRSRSEILYRLPQHMQRFSAIVGIDPATLGQGSLTLEISADDRVVWHGEITGESQPTKIHAQLGKARRLRILVDYGANLDYGDRLHLVDARVTK